MSSIKILFSSVSRFLMFCLFSKLFLTYLYIHSIDSTCGFVFSFFSYHINIMSISYNIMSISCQYHVNIIQYHTKLFQNEITGIHLLRWTSFRHWTPALRTYPRWNHQRRRHTLRLHDWKVRRTSCRMGLPWSTRRIRNRPNAQHYPS